MKLKTTWKQKLQFTAETRSLSVPMDSNPPLGDGTALTPKELLLAAISGCSGMDVASLLKKHRQPVESFEIEADATPTEGSYPVVFREIKLAYRLRGAVDRGKALEAVQLSQTKFCGVSAMVSKAVPLTYTVELNGETIGGGKAEFP